jgi:hypothetical protein
VSTHLSRKELKQDNVALKVEETTHFLVTHRDLAIKVGIGTLVVLGIAAASWFFITSRRDARELALSNALQTVSAPVGAPTAGSLSYPTQQAKTDAERTAFKSIISQDSGSEEAYAAEYSLAGIDVAAGNTDQGIKEYDDVISQGNADYASMAKLSKAQLLFSLNRNSEAQTILKDLMDHPTSMVSKDQAAMALANGLASTQPEEARKLLLPLANAHNDISQSAVTALGELPAAK